MAEWYYRFMGETVGPISAEELKAHASQGRISAEAFVCRGKDGKWVPAQSVRGLQVPAPVAPPPQIPKPVHITRSESKKETPLVTFRDVLRRDWIALTLIVSLLVWVSAAGSTGGVSGVLCYPAMVAAAISIAAHLVRRWPRGIVLPCMVIGTLCLLIFWGRTDT